MTPFAGNLYYLPDTSPRNQWGPAGTRQGVAIPALRGEKARSAAEPAEPAEGRRGSPKVAAGGFSGVAGRTA
jgi:hypothetical protein